MWRVIRINPDSSIRIITNEAIANNAYNSTYVGIKYVGYTYDRTSNSLGTPSQIKNTIDNWYEENINNIYSEFINEEALFCNDTSGKTYSSGAFWYGSSIRLNMNKTPTFSCPTTDKTYGGSYNLPVATITADEVAYAGAVYNNTLNCYLSNENSFWTMSPYGEDSGSKNSSGYAIDSTIKSYYLNNSYGIRPVVELKAGILADGNGTIDDPWVIVS